MDILVLMFPRALPRARTKYYVPLPIAVAKIIEHVF